VRRSVYRNSAQLQYLYQNDLVSLARAFSDDQVSLAVNAFLLERGLELSDFAMMREREFVRLFESDSQIGAEFLYGLMIALSRTRGLSAGNWQILLTNNNLNAAC
jgi:hypothetical protein